MKSSRKNLAERKKQLVLRSDIQRRTIALEMKKFEAGRLMIGNALALIAAAMTGWKLVSAWRKERPSGRDQGGR